MKNLPGMMSAFESILGAELTPLEKERKKIEERRNEKIKTKLESVNQRKME